ncbi:hypothetical protein OROGR_018113 [Orobanche gracilis]
MEKLRESLRAYIQAEPWELLTQEEFSNIGIAVGLRILLILDVLQHLTPLMTTDAACCNAATLRVRTG